MSTDNDPKKDDEQETESSGPESPLERQEPETARQPKKVRWGLMSFLGIIASSVLIFAVLYSFEFISIPNDPLATKGQIYVDSPEVYTRERLVNDRYDQDHWLRERLNELNEAENLLGASLSRRAGVNRQAPESAAISPDSQASENQSTFPFDQEFRIKSAVRDMIRQLILENMLDDRHDLTGNSVFGLKFDTTIIPGTNTRSPAFVRVHLQAPEAFGEDLTALQDVGTSGPIPNFIAQYYEGINHENWDPRFGQEQTLAEAYGRYTDWLDDIETRLNQTWLDKLENSNRKCRDEGVGGDRETRVANNQGSSDMAKAYIDDLTGESIELVLGIPLHLVQIIQPSKSNSFTRIDIPKPWSDYMQIHLERPTGFRNIYTCEDRPSFIVSRLFETLYLLDFDDGQFPQWANETGFVPFRQAPEKKMLAFRVTPGTPVERYEKLGPKFVPDRSHLEFILAQGDLFEGCAFGLPDSEDCKDRVYKYFPLPSGLFRFIEDVAKTDAYSYAIFPRNDVVGIINETAVGASIPNASGERDWFNYIQQLRKTEAASVLIGYGNSQAHSNGSTAGNQSSSRTVEFGWVIFPQGRMKPTQKAQMALVSVPGWVDGLSLEVTVGWLDRDAQEEFQETFPVYVPLPATEDAFDSLLQGSKIPRAPKILDDFMDPTVLKACEPARLLIPGLRLWRSATVTLGAQKANRISVLPNMEGIVAEFTSVDIPNARLDENLSCAGTDSNEETSACVPIRVWTSEGSDRAEVDARIILPELMACEVPKDG